MTVVLQTGACGAKVDTNAGDKSTADEAFTPINALMYAWLVATGNVATWGLTDTHVDGLGSSPGWLLVPGTTAVKNSSADQVVFFVRKSLAGTNNGNEHATTSGMTGSTGGGPTVGYATGMSLAGASAIRQVGIQNNGASGGTPTVTLPAACLTTNAVLGIVFVTTNGTTITGPSGWGSQGSVGYGSPNAGYRTTGINSGFTGSTVTWGSTAPSAFCAVVVEFDATAPAAAATPQPHVVAQAVMRTATRCTMLRQEWRRTRSGILVPELTWG